MPNENTAEVHFHQQEQLSVYVQSTISDIDERIGEIGLASFYAARMLVNLGQNETSANLAELLSKIRPVIPLLASGETTGGFALIRYPGHAGRHSFFSSLSWTSRGPNFTFKPRGFGFFGKGMGYYGPVSVLGLIRFLAVKRQTESEFHGAIGDAIATIGLLYSTGQLGISNQNRVALSVMEIAASALRGGVNPIRLPKPAKRSDYPSGYFDMNLSELKSRLASLMPCNGRHLDELTDVLGEPGIDFNTKTACWTFLLPNKSANIHFDFNDKQVVCGRGWYRDECVYQYEIEDELFEMMETVSEQRYREQLGDEGFERLKTLIDYDEMLLIKDETRPFYEEELEVIKLVESHIQTWPKGEFEALKSKFGSWLEQI